MEKVEKHKQEVLAGIMRRLSLNETDNELTPFLEDLITDTTNLFLMKRYPFDQSKTEIDLTVREWNWVLRACVEIYQGLGYAGIKSYIENGLSVTFDDMNGSISQALDDEITPFARTRVL